MKIQVTQEHIDKGDGNYGMRGERLLPLPEPAYNFRVAFDYYQPVTLFEFELEI